MKSSLFAAMLLIVACDVEQPSDTTPEVEVAAEQAAEPVRTEPPAPATGGKPSAPSDDVQAAVMPDAQAAFGEVIDLLDEYYVDGPPASDAVWTGATTGVLDRLIQLGDHRINTLLPPKQLSEIESETAGEIVGIGVAIEMVADVLVVRDVLPGTPSEAAGLRAGDRILAIDGERTTGSDLGTLVYKIRGPAGTKTELFVQRDTEEWTVDVERQTVKFSGVDGRMLDDSQGYLRIGMFTEHTPTDVDAQLAALSEQGMRSLVIDVRGCPGGLLDAAVAVAERFVAKGLPIASVSKRDGDDKVFSSENEYPWQTLSLVLLIGPDTASGAEILAMALADHDRATLVGQPTLGKGTVETVHELSNGWGLKLSTGRFYGPKRERNHGQPVQPHLRIGDGSKPPSSADRLDLEGDAALVGARQLLRASTR